MSTLVSDSDVAFLYGVLSVAGIELWIDGGWGVDALLQKQTRKHSDIDIVVQERDIPKMRLSLENLGFVETPQEDTKPWNFVLADRKGRKVDVHVIVFDPKGNGIYGPPENGQLYPAYAFKGAGVVNQVSVKCMSAKYQLVNHRGYALRAVDYHDVHALAEKFGMKLPKEYRSR